MNRLKRPLLLLAILCLALPALADVVVLKDGRRIEGTILVENAQVVRVKTALGEIEFERKDVASIERKKTKRQEYDERKARAKTADEFHALGLWAAGNKLRGRARKCMQRALELEPQHAGAHAWLGHVEYKGEWMTPEERDARMKLDEEAELRARGLVEYEGRWVTTDERKKLEAGLVLHEGRWIPFAEAQRLRGLEEYQGRWIPRSEALARISVAAVAKAAEVTLNLALNADVVVAGDVEVALVQEIADKLSAGRLWFDARYAAKPGLALLGDRLAEFYVFEQNAPYLATIPYFAGLTDTLPPGWAKAVQRAAGFMWWDPYPCSSARRWKRNERDLPGHCYHHWGHLLLNRLGYDGRLLPPWYDEGSAALMEHRLHERNAIFCVSAVTAGTGTSAQGAVFWFDPKTLREGKWRQVLKDALVANQVPSLDKLAQREYSTLEQVDIVASMGILEWLASRGKEALPAFHATLRKHGPKPPLRVIQHAHERQAAYDAAFQAACKLGWRQADREWRKWFLGR